MLVEACRLVWVSWLCVGGLDGDGLAFLFSLIHTHHTHTYIQDSSKLGGAVGKAIFPSTSMGEALALIFPPPSSSS